MVQRERTSEMVSQLAAPAIAIATLTIAVNLVIDNLPGAAQAEQDVH